MYSFLCQYGRIVQISFNSSEITSDIATCYVKMQKSSDLHRVKNILSGKKVLDSCLKIEICSVFDSEDFLHSVELSDGSPSQRNFEVDVAYSCENMNHPTNIVSYHCPGISKQSLTETFEKLQLKLPMIKNENEITGYMVFQTIADATIAIARINRKLFGESRINLAFDKSARNVNSTKTPRVLTEPDWLQNLKLGVRSLIVNKCSHRVIQAVELNEDIQVSFVYLHKFK